MFPFSPQKVLRKIIDPPSPERPKTPPTVVQQPTILFHDVKSSPPDAQILHSANVHLNRMVQKCTELPTPARNYIRRVTNFAEEFQAELAITRTQYQELRTVVSKRVERKAGKRKSLEGQHLVSRVEFKDEWGEQERQKKEKQKVKRTKPKQKPSGAEEEQGPA